jgi:hypothetical protein
MFFFYSLQLNAEMVRSKKTTKSPHIVSNLVFTITPVAVLSKAWAAAVRLLGLRVRIPP